ncbi:MAG: hypothetical protein RL422_1925 [Bacteroidota bacterium]
MDPFFNEFVKHIFYTHRHRRINLYSLFFILCALHKVLSFIDELYIRHRLIRQWNSITVFARDARIQTKFLRK